MKYAVRQSIVKIDAKAMTAGRPVYTEDLAPRDCLIVKVLRSPYAFARIRAIDTRAAQSVPGVEAVFTWRDVPPIRHTLGGHAFSFASPFDRLILEDTVRYVGDAVAIIAAVDEESAARALRRVKVDYEPLEAVLDPREAIGHMPPIHAHIDDYQSAPAYGSDPAHNLVAHYEMKNGDVERAFASSDVVLEDTFHTKANSHCMMETFRTVTYWDANGKLVILTSTQIPFLVRRTAAEALGIPLHRVRVVKPKVGGGFGAKQSLVSELLCAVVTLKTGRAAKLIFTRKESFASSNSRHENYIRVRLGATRDGVVKAVSVHTLSNAGAYAEQAFPSALLSGVKTIPMFGKAQGFDFCFDIAYTNTMAGGAFRGFGATQGFFATESMTNRLAAHLGMDPCVLRLKNIPRRGEVMPAYFGEELTSSSLERCIETGKRLIGWDEKYPCKALSSSRVRAVGMATAMQSSGVSGSDKCCASVRLNEDGSYTVSNGAGDMGTGCDTILAQIAAETLLCPMACISVNGVDTDVSPYDKGSYASSTTYVTGMAMVKACRELIETMRLAAGHALGVAPKGLTFDGTCFFDKRCGKQIMLAQLARLQVAGPGSAWMQATGSHCAPASPPPMMAGFTEIELDIETGAVKVLDFVGVIDCGTVINPNLATIQAQGGIAQGIGMALFEDIRYDNGGAMMNGSFLSYKIPSRLDVPNIRIAFESSYEPSGPYGAKSIGEVVINTPAPAIASAIYNACGILLSELPMTPEKVRMALLENERTGKNRKI